MEKFWYWPTTFRRLYDTRFVSSWVVGMCHLRYSFYLNPCWLVSLLALFLIYISQVKNRKKIKLFIFEVHSTVCSMNYLGMISSKMKILPQNVRAIPQISFPIVQRKRGYNVIISIHWNINQFNPLIHMVST